MSKLCRTVIAMESFGDEDGWESVECLLPSGHEGPHAGWEAWLGVPEPDFTHPGASKQEAQ